MTARPSGRLRALLCGVAAAGLLLGLPAAAHGAPGGAALPRLSVDFGGAGNQSPEQISASLQVLLLLTVLSLAPAIVTMLTSFARIVIVLSFTRSALGASQVPPNTVLIGLALFLTVFTMAPVWQQIDKTALQPYQAHQITYQAAIDRASEPVRGFMFRQVRPADLSLFVGMAKMPQPAGPADIPTYVLAPAFIISELKTAFIMGFIIFIPFMIVDMVVASSLMSMGMMMMPPMLVSLPCKLLLFVLVDGWHLITQGLVNSFH